MYGGGAAPTEMGVDSLGMIVYLVVMRIGGQIFIPQKAQLTCRVCRKQPSPKRIKADGGRCRCGKASWRLTTHYVLAQETEYGVGVGTFGGLGVQSTTHTQTAEPMLSGLDAETALWLCEVPREFLARVSELMVEAGDAEMEARKEAKLAAGASECQACKRVFTPPERIPPTDFWSADACCSKSCWIRAHPGQKPPGQPAGDEGPAAPTPAQAGVAVTCSAGHAFEVPKMFSGMKRPCPTCGEKTRVP